MSLIHFANGTSVWRRDSRRRDLNVKGPQRAETAPISVARQGPLTCPLATFAVAIYNGSFTSIVFSNESRAGASFGFRRFRVPVFSACSFGT
jgi:hypothetical protein